MVTLVVFFIVLRQRGRGAEPGEPTHLELMRSYAATPRRSCARRACRTPCPYLFTALKIAAPAAVITAFVAEYFGGTAERAGLSHHVEHRDVEERRRLGLRARRLPARSDCSTCLHPAWRASPHHRQRRRAAPGGANHMQDTDTRRKQHEDATEARGRCRARRSSLPRAATTTTQRRRPTPAAPAARGTARPPTHRAGTRCRRRHRGTGRHRARRHRGSRRDRRRRARLRHAATPVKLQLQWFTQAQFAGYFAAIDQGFYDDARASTSRSSKAASTSCRSSSSPTATSTSRSAWVPKALATREAGADIINIAQVFQRSGTLQVSFKDEASPRRPTSTARRSATGASATSTRSSPRSTKAGLDPATDVELVQQHFDMVGLLDGDIDAAEAMTYNEYAQVLEARTRTPASCTRPTTSTSSPTRTPASACCRTRSGPTAASSADAAYQRHRGRVRRRVAQGLGLLPRQRPRSAATSSSPQGSKLGASHQLWQMNEINKLIWPAAGGVGVIDQAAWDRTVEIARAPRTSRARPCSPRPPTPARSRTTSSTRRSSN